MDAFNSWLTFLVLILDLLQGLEWLYKKVKALYHARHQRSVPPLPTIIPSKHDENNNYFISVNASNCKL